MQIYRWGDDSQSCGNPSLEICELQQNIKDYIKDREVSDIEQKVTNSYWDFRVFLKCLFMSFTDAQPGLKLQINSYLLKSL